MKPAIIECESLSKVYAGARALDQLGLQLSINAPTGLVGANGAGKSTLLNILCGFIQPSAGKIRVLGHHPQDMSLKSRLSILPQVTGMYKNISVATQLCHYARLQGYSRTDAEQESKRVLSLVTADKLGKQYPETLSFGQRKKVMLAQALIGKPELILLDEPTSGLDPVATHEIHQLLEDLGQQYSLIISSHNLIEIEGICQDIVVINHGKLVKTGTINDIKQTHQCYRVKLENKPETDIGKLLNAIPGVTSVEQEAQNSQRYQLYFEESQAQQVQIAILEKLNSNGIGVSEISRGSALADEISRLLKA